MSARQLAEWQAYCAVEPFGPPAEFWRAGMVASVLANVNRGKNSKPFKPEDFMPKSINETPEPDQDAMSQAVLHNFKTYAERVKQRGE